MRRLSSLSLSLSLALSLSLSLSLSEDSGQKRQRSHPHPATPPRRQFHNIRYTSAKVTTYHIQIPCFFCSVCSTMSKGIFALFSVADRSALSTIDSFGRTFNLPYISYDEPSINSAASNYSIYMKPLYHTAIIDILLHYQWTRLIYLYDTEQGRLIIPIAVLLLRRWSRDGRLKFVLTYCAATSNRPASSASDNEAIEDVGILFSPRI